MIIKKRFTSITFCALLTAASVYSVTANAAMVSYYLDQTNVDQGGLIDGINYATVAIDDDTAGQITFTITPLSPLTSIASTNFGIQAFDFNVIGTNPLNDSPSPEWTLPSGWTAKVAPPPNQADGFGSFSAEVNDGGSNRQNTLSFQISTSTGLTIDSFQAPSTGGAGQGNAYFSAHIAGFNGPGSGNGQVTSGYFGGSTLAPVPIPAAGWLLLSGFAALGGTAMMRRRRNNFVHTAQFA